MESKGNLESLQVEYAQIHETKRDYVKTLLQIVIVYLALTGVAADYALADETLTFNSTVAAVLDIILGAFGSAVMFAGRSQVKKYEARLEKVCNELGIYYGGDKIEEWSVWAIFVSYICVVIIWAVIFVVRL